MSLMKRSKWPEGKCDDEQNNGEDEVSTAAGWSWGSHRDISLFKSVLLVHAGRANKDRSVLLLALISEEFKVISAWG